MGKRLSFYTQESFKEVVLPSVNNADHQIILNKHEFHFEQDLELQMEIVDGEWKFKSNRGYQIYKDKEEYQGEAICDGDLLRIVTADKTAVSVIVKEIQNAITVFEKYDLSNTPTITIGKGQEKVIIYDYQGLVSKDHAKLFYEDHKWYIEIQGRNGSYINAKYTVGKEELHFGDYINIVGLHMVFLGNILAIDTANSDVVIEENTLRKYDIQYSRLTENNEEEVERKRIFHRSPRSQVRLETERVVIEEPPAANQSKQQPLLMTIGPSFTMVLPMMLGCFLMMYSSRAAGTSTGLYMYSGLLMSLSSAAVGVGWALVNLNYQKKKEKEEEIHRFEAYSHYLVTKTEEIKEKYEKNTSLLQQRYLAPTECVKYDENSSSLWGRNMSHQDFLSHRLGIGKIPFQVPIDIPAEKFKLWNDSLNEKPRLIYENYKTLYNVPIVIDLLQKNLVGVIGGKDKAGALKVAQLLSAQIAANNSYTDVKLAYIYDENSSTDWKQWNFARWLPHVWSEDKKIRFLASNKSEASDVLYEITKVFRQREEQNTETGQKEGLAKPHFVLFVSDAKILEGELLSKYIYTKGKGIGLTTIILTDRYENLPNECEYIIQNDSQFKGMYDIFEPEDKRCEIEFDAIDLEELERFSRRLSNIEVQEVEQGGEIPQSLTFFEMYHVNRLEDFHVLERWKKNRTYDNIRAVIGEKAGGSACYMDLHEKYHGPHGLVAGTTGSGKSETLQTYLLSLAINYSPDDIAYFIIDYKGGGMANLFSGLPHMIGQISNLSGNQVHRAMVSIKSENRRRQRVFSDNGVNNINAYTKLYKSGEADTPVPHLFIIIDEFAELKREEPDFMRELISVAQVGRSLGVHLILATQKPSGTVDDNIWSNSKFRLCLRVQDKQDSMDMLHKPDAAYITQAGRCYLQVGNDEVYELFQSGWSGARYDEDDVGKVDIARLLTASGKVEIKGSYAKSSQKERIATEWLRVLVKVVQEAMIRKNLTVQECMDIKSKMQSLIDEMYQVLESREIEYARSNFNSARLEDFVRLYARSNGEASCSDMLHVAEEEGIRLPQAKEKTQLDAICTYLDKIAQENHYRKSLQLWMPVLPSKLYLEELIGYKKETFADGKWKKHNDIWSLDVLIGKIDDPNNQEQIPLNVNLSENGNIAIVGTVLSGKSTFLQTLAFSLVMKYTPDYINLYMLDFSSKMMSAFDGMPHVGSVMYEGDMERIAKFFTMMDDILEERKRLFRGGNYSQYVQVQGVKLPAVIIMIDNYAAFAEKTEGKYHEKMLRLAKEGISHGIYLVMTAAGFSMNEIPNRLAENIKNVIALEMPDKFAYTDVLHTMSIDVMPEKGVKGRGLVLTGERVLEFQTALALKSSDDYARMEAIREKGEELLRAWSGAKARRIPEIPEKPVWSEFAELDDVKRASEERNLLPVAYNAENASVYSLDLSQIYCYLITGTPHSGKKNYMKAMIESALLKDSHVCILDSSEKKIRTYEENEKIVYLSDEDAIHDYFLTTLTPVFVARNKKKKQLMEQDLEDREIFDEMSQEQPWFIFIPDLVAFDALLNGKYSDMKGFMNNLVKKGSLHNIYFIASMQVKERTVLAGSLLYEEFRNYKKGIHFGGNVTENTILGFDHIPYREQAKVYPAGVGLISNMDAADSVDKIVVPLVKKRK